MIAEKPEFEIRDILREHISNGAIDLLRNMARLFAGESGFVEKKMDKLMTPFGKIKILIDGETVSYSVQEGIKRDSICSHVLGRYQIVVPYMPDGKGHCVSCIFEPVCSYKRTPESGEHFECQSFYNENRFKMSIGIDGEQADYLENGIAVQVLPDTQKEKCVFGIAWKDGVGWNDSDDIRGRDAETWYAADPSLSL